MEFIAQQSYLMLIILVLALTIISIFLIIAYTKLSKKYSVLEDLNSLNDIKDKEEEIINNAREEYKRIIENASQVAKEVIINAISVKKGSEEELRIALEEFEKVQEELIKKGANTLLEKFNIKVEEPKLDDINIQNNISKHIEEYKENQVDEYKSIIKAETLVSEKILEEKSNQQYKRIENEIEEYKRDKLRTVDEDILKLVKKVVSLTLKDSIKLKDQEKLVLEALEKAKKEEKLNA